MSVAVADKSVCELRSSLPFREQLEAECLEWGWVYAQLHGTLPEPLGASARNPASSAQGAVPLSPPSPDYPPSVPLGPPAPSPPPPTLCC